MPPENDNVDYSRIEGWLGKQATRADGNPPRDGGPGDLTRRVDAIEADVKDIKVDVKGLVRDVAEIKGRLSNMPTTFQMLTWFMGIALGLVGLVFTVARVTGTH